MKSIKSMLLFLAITLVFVSCSKSVEDAGLPCEINETTKVTFTNTNAFAVTLELADRFDAQYKPVGLVFSIALAPGASATREFKAGRYYYQYSCPTCNGNVFSRTYVECNEYED